MTGKYLADLMQNDELKGILAKHARRRSKVVETQEEFIQDAWLRIAKKPEGMTIEWYSEHGRKAVEASYRRSFRQRSDGDKKTGENVTGISVTGKEDKPPPKRCLHLGRNRWLDPRPIKVEWEYYEGQEKDIEAGLFEIAKLYNQHESFDTLDTHEQRKLIGKLRNSGYLVGSARGGTRGKDQRFFVVITYVDNRTGLIEKAEMPKHFASAVSAKVIREDKPNHKRSLSNWYALLEYGGSDEWVEWVKQTIAYLENRASE